MLNAVLIVLAFALALYYAAMLTMRSDWRANPAIKSLFWFSWIIVLQLALAVWRQLVEPPPDWARTAVFLLVIVGLAVQAGTITRVQNRRSARIERERREGIEALEERR